MKLNTTIKKCLISLTLFLVTLEIGLRITGQFKTYAERNAGKYISYWSKARATTWYHNWRPNELIQYNNKEFKYSYPANSLGLREIEYVKNVDKSLVITIGDSFTEGDGAPYEGAYPRHLEQLLNDRAEKVKPASVYNAGVCGSDVWFSYTLIRDKLLAYHPDLIIVAINTSDINDLFIRGGKERFQPNMNVKYKNGPWFKELFRISHIVRGIVHYAGYDDDLINSWKKEQLRNESIISIIEAIRHINFECKSNNTKCVFVLHPVPGIPPDSDLDFRTIKDVLPSHYPIYDIYKDMDFATKDLDANDFFWPINGHYNEYGYKIMAEIIYRLLKKENHLKDI